MTLGKYKVGGKGNFPSDPPQPPWKLHVLGWSVQTHDSEHLLTDWRLTAEFQVVWFKVGVWLVPQGNGTRGKSCSDVALGSWGSIL